MVTSAMCISLTTRFITSTGHGEPAMIPVRRLEAGGGDDDAGTVRGAGEVAENHAEAVVERHRDADPVGLGVPAAFPDEEPVIEDVVVGQGRALGEARRPAGVLDVDRVVE